MQLAEITDRAEVWTVLAHNSDESQVAFASQGDLTARKHPDTIGIEQQADHHGRIVGWGTPGFVLIRRIEAASLHLRHGIEQEKDQIAFGQLGLRLWASCR